MAIGPTSQKDQISLVLALIGILGAGAYFYFVYQPKSQQLGGIATHIETLDRSNQRAKNELAKGSVNDLREQARQYQKNLQLMRQLVPTSNEVPSLLEQVSTAARRAGLDIGTVTPEPVISGEAFDTYRYKLTINGGYHEISEFLANVGSLTRIIAPVNLKLGPSTQDQRGRKIKAGDAFLTCDFEIQTYVAKAGTASDRDAPKGEPKT
jgi:type IV pilus assembly protein PilO